MALTLEQQAALLEILPTRFERHAARHPGIRWAEVWARLEADPDKLTALAEMERTGGEPDVVGQEGDAHVWFDCAAESPAGRRNLCYDRAALDARKVAKPVTSALEMAAQMGISLLTEEQYRRLQTLGDFDTKTSSWIVTPERIRRLGGALFGDRRYNTVFIYHNGAQSYYAARGWRGCLTV